jgi:hypothetical protein
VQTFVGRLERSIARKITQTEEEGFRADGRDSRGHEGAAGGEEEGVEARPYGTDTKKMS